MGGGAAAVGKLGIKLGIIPSAARDLACAAPDADVQILHAISFALSASHRCSGLTGADAQRSIRKLRTHRLFVFLPVLADLFHNFLIFGIVAQLVPILVALEPGIVVVTDFDGAV
jgi:hypothetical protein